MMLSDDDWIHPSHGTTAVEAGPGSRATRPREPQAG